MYTRALAAAAVRSTAAAQATLLWQQHLDVAVYTSAGLSRRAGLTPTFSTATVRVPRAATTWWYGEPAHSQYRACAARLG